MGSHDASAQRLIRQFNLKPHPEGGYYRETYRSATEVPVAAGWRAASTAIYYMLEPGAHSAWHRIASDELWHFYAGSALNVYELDEDQGLITHRLGDSLRDPACTFQAVISAGRWFAAELASDAASAAFDGRRDKKAAGTAAGEAPSGAPPDAFALVGCTVAPGFDFSEFEMADARALIRQYPAHAGLIGRLAAVQR